MVAIFLIFSLRIRFFSAWLLFYNSLPAPVHRCSLVSYYHRRRWGSITLVCCGPGALEENSGCEKWTVHVWEFQTSANKAGGEIMGKDKNVKKDTKKKPSKTLKEKQ